MPKEIAPGLEVETVADILARGVGDNNPPEPTPFEVSRDTINDLREEARTWLDGEEITTQGQSDDVAKLAEALRQAHKTADTARKVENEPFDTGKAEVQGRYNPILKIAKDSEDVARRAVAKFLQKQEEERRRQAAEAQRIADEQTKAAREAMEAAREADNLSAHEDAEKLVEEAAETARLAVALDKGKSMAVTGGERRMSLRSTWVPSIEDRLETMRHFWRRDASAFDDLLLQLAREAIRSGVREIPGCKITEEMVAR